MKTAWKLTMVMVLVLAVFAACSKKEKEEPKQSAPPAQQEAPAVQAPAAPPATEQAQQPVELTGTLVKTDDGVALFSDSGNYLIEGQDVSDMVGQNVKVSGSVRDKEGKQVLTITSISVVE